MVYSIPPQVRVPQGLSTRELSQWYKNHGGPGLTPKAHPPIAPNRSLTKQIFLCNPYINPLGYLQHCFDPKAPITKLDSPLLKYVA